MNLKVFRAICLFLIICMSFSTMVAQSGPSPIIRTSVYRQQLHLSTKVTSVLVFGAPICEGCIDRGHPDIATSIVTGMRNVLRVKARTTEMPETNLTVFTTDGRIYSFRVSYHEEPIQTLINLEGIQPPPLVQFSATRMNEAGIADFAKVVAATKPEFKRPRNRTNGNMRINLANLYLKEGLLFFKFKIKNSSAIDYDLNFCRFYIRDRKTAKRTAVMEKPVEPVYQLQPTEERVPKFGQAFLIAAIEKFTIADNKYFVVEIFEKNGDRPLILRIKGRHLLSARSD